MVEMAQRMAVPKVVLKVYLKAALKEPQMAVPKVALKVYLKAALKEPQMGVH